MRDDAVRYPPAELDPEEMSEGVEFRFAASRREFVQLLGAGLLISVAPATVWSQQGRRGGGGGRNRGPRNVAARVHIAQDGTVTVMTGKVEGGQGARAELTQAAAEELRMAPERIVLLMADTSLVPDDGTTAGSRTTPSTVPSVREGCAAARRLLTELAAGKWSVDATRLQVRDGAVRSVDGSKTLSYGDLAAEEAAIKAFRGEMPGNIALTPVNEWKALGSSFSRPNRLGLVTGAHAYPSDIVRPGMLHGRILRAPSYGAALKSIDLGPAQSMKDVVVVRDDPFVGVAAPSRFIADRALSALEKTAQWDRPAHPSSKELFEHLRRSARGGMPENPFKEAFSKAPKAFKQTYFVAYAQHAPLEPRAAVAEWTDGKLTVWTATQNPFGVRGELSRAFRLSDENVRVIVPDFGGGFGGKHTGECAVETARLAQAARRPVALRWTREEEFTWAYFRPAALIEVEAGLNADGRLTSWHFVNVNSGGSAIDTPYNAGQARSQFVQAQSPLRTGSYRALASTANNFARESFMDELAAAAGQDPLAFRLAHLENERLRAVLEAAAARFGWSERVAKKDPSVGVGLACGTEKGSYVAACAEVVIDPARGALTVRKVCQAFECGAILNPENLRTQVEGCILMGLGPALREGMEFEGGKVLNASFWRYLVPRFSDVPELDIHLLDRPDLPSVGAGETPIIAVAPAIANAVFHATGRRIREMPIRLAAG